MSTRATQPDAPPPSAPLERARWERLMRPGDRDRLATGQQLLIDAVSRALSIEADDVQVQRACRRCGRSDHGPLSVPGLAVSVSHSEGLVVVALTRGEPVGVDVEALTERPPDVAERALTAREQREHEAVGTSTDLLVRWVRKEAVLKATGAGLTHGMQGLAVSAPGRKPRVVAWSGASRPHGVRRAALADLVLPGGYVGSVAVLGARRISVQGAGGACAAGSLHERPR